MARFDQPPKKVERLDHLPKKVERSDQPPKKVEWLEKPPKKWKDRLTSLTGGKVDQPPKKKEVPPKQVVHVFFFSFEKIYIHALITLYLSPCIHIIHKNARIQPFDFEEVKWS